MKFFTTAVIVSHNSQSLTQVDRTRYKHDGEVTINGIFHMNTTANNAAKHSRLTQVTVLLQKRASLKNPKGVHEMELCTSHFSFLSPPLTYNWITYFTPPCSQAKENQMHH